LNPDNKADGNVYVDMPKDFQGLFEGPPSPTYDPEAWRHIKYRDLAAWRALHGWDRNSILAEAQIDFDPDTLQLSISSSKPLPRAPAVNQIQSDILGRTTGATRIAGPLADLQGKRSWRVDPRIPG
ncbi:MAG: hypothetical protein JF563_02830, partial [Acidobacteriales bacterium]|nr:hypothetical protein [Terriglobales bacterium]